MAAKKKAAAAGKKINKSAFVRSFPNDTPAKDVVEKGKAQGVALSIAYVYSIRANAKRAERRANGVPAPGRRGRANGVPSAGGSARAEELLRAVASELGLSRALEVLQAEQRKVHALLAGR